MEHRHRQEEAERQAAERRRAWEAAMERARERYADARRADTLRGEVARWRDAQEIQAYCDAAESAYAEDPGTATWVSWARHRADELDPLRVAPQMPASPRGSVARGATALLRRMEPTWPGKGSLVDA